MVCIAKEEERGRPKDSWKMKKIFLESIRFVWPEGVGDRRQMRVIIRVYSMGWVDALMATKQTEDLADWVENACSMMNDPAWMPDDSWIWWK